MILCFQTVMQTEHVEEELVEQADMSVGLNVQSGEAAAGDQTDLEGGVVLQPGDMGGQTVITDALTHNVLDQQLEQTLNQQVSFCHTNLAVTS